ncbi:hypothetical protein I7I51_02058 [Histoplasma capsulatum]|uniref:Uncharacterized protein n=1 Tax=Ajellomyces capsulatus TaxID=5037 RepID=A0A8A1MIM8_AJECA|nr:hypothetical protein I7I51_02058 [Histoplasma capsulatum]
MYDHKHGDDAFYENQVAGSGGAEGAENTGLGKGVRRETTDEDENEVHGICGQRDAFHQIIFTFSRFRIMSHLVFEIGGPGHEIEAPCGKGLLGSGRGSGFGPSEWMGI